MNVLVVSAHPDDEVLGCGGTIAYLSRAKHNVHCCFLSEHVAARHTKPDHAKFRRQIDTAHKIIGVRGKTFHNFPNIQMNTVPTLSLVKAIEKAIVDVKPEMVFTHHWGDVNEDHVRVFEATLAAIKLPQRYTTNLPQDLIKRVFCYEVPSSTDWAAPTPAKVFAPNYYFNIEKTLPQKLAAIKQYKEVVRPFPHPCSIQGLRSLADVRGMQSGFKQAEAFFLLKGIES